MPEPGTEWELRTRRDADSGEKIRQLQCPGCGLWASLDDDQVHGRVSIECPTDGCNFHETVDLSTVFAISDRQREANGGG